MHLCIYVWMCASTCIGHIKIKGKLGKEMRLDEEKEYRKWKAREMIIYKIWHNFYIVLSWNSTLYSSKKDDQKGELRNCQKSKSEGGFWKLRKTKASSLLYHSVGIESTSLLSSSNGCLRWTSAFQNYTIINLSCSIQKFCTEEMKKTQMSSFPFALVLSIAKVIKGHLFINYLLSFA